MRAVDRNPRTKNHTRLTADQRRLAGLVCALRRAQNSWDAPPVALVEEVASAVAGATWGPFGAFFITINEPYWAGVDHRYKTVWVGRRPVLTIQLLWDGTHLINKVFSIWESEQYFEEGRARRREAAAQAAEKAAHARRLIGRATPAQRAYMYEASWGDEPVDPLAVKHGAQPIDGWEFNGSFFVRGWERLPAHAAVRATVSKEEVARTVRDLRQNAERREREAARARAAGVARIGRGISEAAWTAICLAREAEAEAAARNMRRIHA